MKNEAYIVIAARFERATVCLEGRCSIQLSYATLICGETGTRTLATLTRRQISNLLHYHSGTSPILYIVFIKCGCKNSFSLQTTQLYTMFFYLPFLGYSILTWYMFFNFSFKTLFMEDIFLKVNSQSTN